ncbi:MAG: Type pilus assembly protein PilM [Gammaproteobacteria bacterium]|jgi:Tfp pilus assembly PilM family ATPase|nr:Type pilus assembly protein PilM [Gammaproteobacteria bacterium]
MRHTEFNSIGIELSNQSNSILCLQKNNTSYQALAYYQLSEKFKDPAAIIEQLVSCLSHALPQPIKNASPAYIALSDRLVNQQIMEIEGDILRLRPHAVDEYVFNRAAEFMHYPISECYVDYSLIQAPSQGPELTKVLLAWSPKQDLDPYLSVLKALKLKSKVVELADMARKRFYSHFSSIQRAEELAPFAASCGAALRRWEYAA